MQRANGFRFALSSNHQVHHLGLGLLVSLIRPDSTTDKMVLEAEDRIAKGPCIVFGLGAIGRRIIRGGVSAGAIGHIFDDGRPKIAPGAFHCPFCNRMDGQIIVAVDTQSRNAKAVAACSKVPEPPRAIP